MVNVLIYIKQKHESFYVWSFGASFMQKLMFHNSVLDFIVL